MSDLTENWTKLGTGPALPTLAGTTGTRLSEIGCGKPLTESAALGQLKPAETDQRVAAALRRITGRSPGLKIRTMFPTDGPTYRVVERVEWGCPAERLDEAKAVVEGSLRSAPEATLGAALYRLRMLTRGRDQRAELDMEAEALVWLQELRCWPADVALETIRSWPTKNPWWPTWCEIQADMRKACEYRRALAAHLNAGAPEPAAALPEPERPTLEKLKARCGENWGINSAPEEADKRKHKPLSPAELRAKHAPQMTQAEWDAIPNARHIP